MSHSPWANPPRLLVVDDESTQRSMLQGILRRAGYDVTVAADGAEALAILERQEFDLLLTDQRMPGMDGLALLPRARRLHPRMPVVLMTAYGSVADAVAAMKEGATDYLTKPFEAEELLLILPRVLRQRRLEEEVDKLHGALRDRCRLGAIVGASQAMQEIYSLIARVAPTDVPVLVRGESGTGKELVARAIHEESARAAGPFVAQNCAAVPEGLLESEFFGHERGAFTGACRSHSGRFVEAEGGTLFLDEIGTMRFDLQAKLLRALQEKEIQRVGGRGTVKVDVRVVAATSEDLEDAIARKRFREDLYYRLNVVAIRLPPLRERTEDIPALLDHFLRSACARHGREAMGVAPEVIERMQRYPWPGNVRELESAIERMVLLAHGPRLCTADLPSAIRDGQVHASAEAAFALPPEGVDLERLERHLIAQALKRSRGSLGPAARLLGISYKTLQYRIQKHGLDREALAPALGLPEMG